MLFHPNFQGKVHYMRHKSKKAHKIPQNSSLGDTTEREMKIKEKKLPKI